jgi:hypothetical protein
MILTPAMIDNHNMQQFIVETRPGKWQQLDAISIALWCHEILSDDEDDEPPKILESKITDHFRTVRQPSARKKRKNH